MKRGLHHLEIDYFDSLETINKAINIELIEEDLPYYTNKPTFTVIDYVEEY